MSELVELDDYRKIWVVFDAECHSCTHRWVVVAPEARETPWLECPSCGEQRGLRLVLE